MSPRAFFFGGCCIVAVVELARGCWFTGSALPTSRGGSRKSSNKTAARQTACCCWHAASLCPSACLLSLSPPPFSLSHCCCGLCRRRNDGGCFLAPAARSGRRLEWIARGGSSSSRQRATSAFPHSSSAERPADGDIRDHCLTEPPVRCQPASTNPNTRSRTPRTVDLLAGLHRSARLFFPLFSYFTQ